MAGVRLTLPEATWPLGTGSQGSTGPLYMFIFWTKTYIRMIHIRKNIYTYLVDVKAIK